MMGAGSETPQTLSNAPQVTGQPVIPPFSSNTDTRLVFWTTDRHLRVTSCFGPALALLGLPQDGLDKTVRLDSFRENAPNLPSIAAHDRALRGEVVSLAYEKAGRTWQLHVAPQRDRAGEIVGCIGFAQDLTEDAPPEAACDDPADDLERRVRRRAEKLATANRELCRQIVREQNVHTTLAKQAQLSGAILVNMPVMGFLLDKDGVFIESIGAGLARLGRKDHELDGTRATDVFPDIGPWLRRALSGESVHFESGGTIDGRPWAYENLLAPDEVRGLGAIGIAIDITQRKEAEKRVEKHRAELAHIARVRTIEEMASGISHELNQPLSAIVVQAEVTAAKLRRGRPPAPEKLLDMLDHVADQAHRAGQIIHRMRSFVKKAPPRRRPIVLAEVVTEAVDLVRSDLRHAGIDCTIDVHRSLPKILADNVQIQQVFLNLLRNAMDAIDQAGPGPRRIDVRAGVRHAVLEVAVCDTGCGIPDNQVAKSFETFYTTKSKGMGMGLAISRSIIDSHGGQIRAVQNPDRGATFTFTLPIADENEEP